MDSEVLELGRERFRLATGYYDLPKDEHGFVILKPTASRVDRRISSLTTDITDLEDKLKRFRAERAKAQSYTKTEEYKESRKKEKDKRSKKARNAVLSMVFNNVPDEDGDEDDEGYRDSRKGSKKKEKAETTLESRYGKRYAPIVSMLYDTAADFARIAADIDAELKTPKGQVKNMYRSTQIGNMLSALNSRMGAIDKIGRIADKVTDIEYKKEKDKRDKEGTDSSKLIANLGGKFLRGSLFDDEGAGKKGKKKKGSKKGSSNFEQSAKSMGIKPVDDDDDDEEVSRKKKRRDADDDDKLAEALANELLDRKGEIHFSPYEKHLDAEGKWALAVVCSPTDTKNWSYIAIDPKSGKPLKGDLKDAVKSLIPKRKNARMVIDLPKMKARDLNTGKSYRLMLRDD